MKKISVMIAVLALCSLVCSAGDKKPASEKTAPPAGPSGALFSTNLPAGPVKSAPFSSEISADFIKKVMETSQRIEECKKQIADRQAYLYENNPKIKSYRQEIIGMQNKINAILCADKELTELRLNRDIVWTTMPQLPKPREQQQGMRVQPAGK